VDGEAASHPELEIARIRLELQQAVIDVLSTARSVEAAGQALLPGIGTALRWDFTALWVVEGDAIRCVSAWCAPDQRLDAFTRRTAGHRFATGEGLPGRVWALQQPLYIADLATDPQFPRRDVAREVNLRSGFAFPVKDSGGVVAVVECFSAEAQAPQPHVLAAANFVGRQIGQFFQRLAVERLVAQNERRYAAIVTGALDAIIAIDANGFITEFNPAAERLFGYARGEVLGQEMAALIIPPAMRDAHRAGLRRQRESGESRILERRLELRACRRDGSEFPVELTISRFEGRGEGGFVGFLRDITERQRHAEEREALLVREQAAVQDASAANRLKDEFLAALSHELRTPLNAILGWAQILESGSVVAERIPRAIGAIRRNAEVQQQIVDDMLDLSSFITGRVRLLVEPIAVRRPVAAAVESTKPAAEAKRVTVKLAVPDAIIAGDALRLQQVFWNLLGNAVKFTPPGGTIEVSGAVDGESVTVRVRDSGSGIDPAFLPYVFDRFRQAPNARGGLGLGLAIVRQIVEAHGGTVSASSDGPGQGTEFVVALPLA
jgi:PAS domain S-box-containing protein